MIIKWLYWTWNSTVLISTDIENKVIMFLLLSNGQVKQKKQIAFSTKKLHMCFGKLAIKQF